ncbi:MAG: hypothetical protein JXR64_07830 [Spirochaetales bacterium]|nr:hypothetical protein [Spirochaetales bacterium]
MNKIDNIKMINDLVLRTERGELVWGKSEYAGHFLLKNSNGLIEIKKLKNGDISFKIAGSKGDIISDDLYILNKDSDLQIYKVSNILWSLVKDQLRDNKVDFQEILNFLEKEEE